MTTIRAHLVDVLAQVKSQLALDAASAAGSNDILSRAEQGALAPGDTLRAAADDVRAAGASRVRVAPLVDAAQAKVEALLASVNTRAPSLLSKAEVNALVALDYDVGARVAKAYELITGRHVDLPAPPLTPADPGAVVPAPPTPPGRPPLPPRPPQPAPGSQLPPIAHPGSTPASSQGALPLSGLAATANSVMGFEASVVGNTLQLKGMAGTPGALDLAVDGRPVHVDFLPGKESAGGVGGAFDARNVIEGLRAALPADLELRVAKASSGLYTVDLWSAGSAPPVDAAPQYAYGFGNARVMMTGPLAMKLTHSTMNAGDTLSFRIDEKVYTATAHSASATTGTLARDLKAQMEADGRTVIVKDYGPSGFVSLRVTG